MGTRLSAWWSLLSESRCRRSGQTIERPVGVDDRGGEALRGVVGNVATLPIEDAALDVLMESDETGGDELAFRVDDPGCVRRLEVADRGDPVARDAEVGPYQGLPVPSRMRPPRMT
jgi:hypothetical protein